MRRSNQFHRLLKAGVFSRRGYVMQDPDAAAYVAAVEAAGVTVTNDQRTAIDAFVTTGKSDGWYSSLKRLYLPIWASVAPNAIDMISLTSGTFVGAVTHANGYAETTVPTGHFLADATPSSLGLSSGNAMIFSASYEGNMEFCGCRDESFSRLVVGMVSSFRRAIIPSSSLIMGSGSDGEGILVASRSGDTTSLFQRKSSGWVPPETITAADSTPLPAFPPAFLGNFNNAGTVSTGRTTAAKYISYGYGLGLSAAQAEAFTLAVKNLWETCTGLTLP